jgi:hypothetical protein
MNGMSLLGGIGLGALTMTLLGAALPKERHIEHPLGRYQVYGSGVILVMVGGLT